MPAYNERILRENVPIPVETVNEIIQDLPQQSVALTRMRKVRMSSKTRKQPVLASLPVAYWVDGDTGLKQTTKATWDNVVMTAEELAALIPVPNAVIDDSDMPIWELVKPLLVEAIGNKVDHATLFGVDKPTTWPTALVPAAIAVGTPWSRALASTSAPTLPRWPGRSPRMASPSTDSPPPQASTGS